MYCNGHACVYTCSGRRKSEDDKGRNAKKPWALVLVLLVLAAYSSTIPLLPSPLTLSLHSSSLSSSLVSSPLLSPLFFACWLQIHPQGSERGTTDAGRTEPEVPRQGRRRHNMCYSSTRGIILYQVASCDEAHLLFVSWHLSWNNILLKLMNLFVLVYRVTMATVPNRLCMPDSLHYKYFFTFLSQNFVWRYTRMTL